MKTMTKFMFSALCAAAMVTSVSAQGGKDMLSNGIKYLDVPYVAIRWKQMVPKNSSSTAMK